MCSPARAQTPLICHGGRDPGAWLIGVMDPKVILCMPGELPLSPASVCIAPDS